MKTIALLLGFLFVSMVSFSNTLPTNNVLNNVTPVLAEASNPLFNVHINETQPYANNGEVELNNVNVKTRTSTCTMSITTTMEFGGMYWDVTVTTTASTCAEAASRLLKYLPRKK